MGAGCFEGSTKDEASEEACRLAVVHLMWSNLSQMIVHDHQWKIPRDKLIQEVPGRDGTDTVLERNSSQRRKFSAEAASERDGDRA